jgi:chloramphenicol-sensitive protein RarD
VARTNEPRGLAAGFAAYLLWSVFPLYFELLNAAGPLEIVAHRIVWTLVVCVLGVTVRRSWDKVVAAWRDRRLIGRLSLAGVLISLNWLLYIAAILTGHIVDAALGYFINPLVTVVLALVVQRERLRRLQYIALGIGLLAVVVIVVGYGEFPWIGLGLAGSFGTYALIKNRIGSAVSPLVGLGFEALTLTPVALAYIVVLEVTGTGLFLTHSTGYTLGLMATGAVTAAPLLLFAYGSARLQLATVGLLQYITPIGQFALGVWVFHEAMPWARWIGFGLIWVALVALSADALRSLRRPR